MKILFQNKYFTINRIKKIKSNLKLAMPQEMVQIQEQVILVQLFGKIVKSILLNWRKTISSYVAFTDTVRLVGEAVKNQITH